MDEITGEVIAVPSPFAIPCIILLLVFPNGVMNVLTAQSVAQRRIQMSTSTIEEQEAIQVPDLAKKTEPTKKATRAAQKPHVAPAKGKSPDKASRAKKTPKGDKKAAAGKG